MHAVIKRIFRRDILLLLVLTISALLGAIGIPKRMGFENEQILLALLAVLALDTLVERIGYLDRIEKSIVSLKDKIEPQTGPDRLLRPRSDLPPFNVQLKEATEVWVVGKSTHGLVLDYTRQIRQAAKEGKRFRFLLADPANASAMTMLAASSVALTDVQRSAQLSQDALYQLARLISQTPADSIKVRLLRHVPTYGSAVFDGTQAQGYMVVELYGYQISASERLHFRVARSTDPSTFNLYLEQFERMWSDGKPLNSTSTAANSSR